MKELFLYIFSVIPRFLRPRPTHDKIKISMDFLPIVQTTAGFFLSDALRDVSWRYWYAMLHICCGAGVEVGVVVVAVAVLAGCLGDNRNSCRWLQIGCRGCFSVSVAELEK